MSSATTTRQYPAECPKCEHSKGYPVQVRTLSERQGSIEVKLRCRDCNHEWVEIIDTKD